MNIKPVLQIQGNKLDAFAKVRGKQQAKRTMLKAMQHDFETRFKDAAENGQVRLAAAYIGNRDEAEEWAIVIQEAFPGFEFHMDVLSLVIACHIGPGALAIAASKYIPEECALTKEKSQ